MNHQSTNLKNDLVQLNTALEKVLASLPTVITKTLFDTTLFLCRSEQTSDYLQEIQTNLHRLSHLDAANANYQWLYARCEEQINAFIQVAMRNRARINQATTGHRLTRSDLSKRQHLQQELSQHHDYERRLKENLFQAQEAAHDSGDHQRVMVCQQRLIRCQQAIAKLERAIESQSL